MHRLAAGLVLAALAVVARAEPAPERVSFPSLDGAGRAPVVLTGWLMPSGANGPAPAVVLLHGCGGAYDRRGALSHRMREYARLVNELGAHALVVDSLTPRYETELCTQRLGKRRVTQAHRRLDALGAVAYLAARPEVDAHRIGLLGWSNGGSTVLAATNLKHRDVADAPTRPAFAVAFYPGCETDLKRGYDAQVPLLLLLGDADDWTPAAECRALAAAATGAGVELESYAGAYHGFDGDEPVRLRKDVPNGAHPGQGVHVGVQPEAKRLAQARLLRFIAQRLAG